MLQFLRRYFGGKVQIRVVIYTRKICPLCDEAKELVERYARLHRFEMELIDVDSDPKLVERFGDKVPVVMINDVERFYGRINEVLFRRLLNAIRKQQTPPSV